MTARWIILGQGGRLRWGGDLRRHYLLAGLAAATGTQVRPSWNREALTAALEEPNGGRPRLASVELLGRETLALAVARTSPIAVDLHDEPVSQAEELGHPLTADEKDGFRTLIASNMEAFRYVVTPSREFAGLAGIDGDRLLIAPNGTDSRLIVPGPWPERPTVGMVSGASPRRGIEILVEACRRLRFEASDLRLRLALVGTTDDGRAYLESLRASLIDEPWVTIDTVPYAKLSPWLAETSVLVLPHPAGRYYDAALPIKLFDYFAAGRPVVTTPRAATAERVIRHGAGLVADGNAPDDLALSIGRVLASGPMARRLGAAGRAAAESTYDWQLIGRRLGDDLLRRADRVRWFQVRAAHLGHRFGRVVHPGPGRPRA